MLFIRCHKLILICFYAPKPFPADSVSGQRHPSSRVDPSGAAAKNVPRLRSKARGNKKRSIELQSKLGCTTALHAPAGRNGSFKVGPRLASY